MTVQQERSAYARPAVFLLVRHSDVTGISGTGIVAEGAEWSDGSVSLRWRGDHPTTTFFQTGIGGVRTIHGHHGATDVVYINCPATPGHPLGDRVDDLCAHCGGAWPCTECRGHQ